MTERSRLRFEYVKHDRLAFLGHLEVITTIQRCIRRARLPFAVGNGYAHRMKIQFSQALPVGASSACEYFDLTVEEPITCEEALSMLRTASPSALAPMRAGYVDRKLPALEAWLDRSLWQVELLGSGFDAMEVTCAVNELVSRGQITYLRGDKEKTVDLESTFISFQAADTRQGVEAILESRSTPEGALRPGVLVSAAARELASDALASATVRVRRIGQWHEAEDGRLVEAL